MKTLRGTFQSASQRPAVRRGWKVLIDLLPALFFCRISAEFLFPSLPVAVLIGLVIGAVITAAARRLRLVNAAVLLLLPAVLWPYQDPALVLTCGILASVSAIYLRWPAGHALLDILPLLLGLLLYGATMAPGVQPADGGEFQLVLAKWGVAHPPGYPLYTILGGGFVRLLPFGDVAWRVNLFSAVTAALTLLVVAQAIRRETGNRWAGLAAAATLGTAVTFWTTATQASIRPMTALFATLMIATTLDYRRAVYNDEESAARQALLRFGLAAGFGVTHHISLLFAGSMLALAIIAVQPTLIRDVRHWAPALLAALAGATPWLYLLIRGAAGALFAPDNLTTWQGFWQHVLATGFGGDMLYYRSWPEVLERLRLIGQVIDFQWGELSLILAAFGFVMMLWRDRWLALTLGSAFALHSLISATYRAPQTVEYMIPAYVCLAAAVGWVTGVASSGFRSANRTAALLTALAITGAFQSGWPTWISLRIAQERDHTAGDARAILATAPPGSVILANWHHATPLWYVQSLESMRPDVEVRYVAPAGAEPILDTWLRLIREESAKRSVVTCSYYPETFRHVSLPFSALGTCWQVGSFVSPPAATALARFADYTLLDAHFPASASAGDRMVVALDWRLPRSVPYGELTSFVHLVDSTGVLLAGDDQPFLAGDGDNAIFITQNYTLHLPRTLPPGTYRLMAGLYRPASDGLQIFRNEEGQPQVTLGWITVGLAGVPPVTTRESYIPFDARLQLKGYDYDLSVPGRARLYLHWAVTEASSNDTWNITVLGAAHELASQSITLTGSGYLTTAHDIPDTEAVRGLWLSVARNGQPLAVHGVLNLPLGQTVALAGPRQGERFVSIGEMVLSSLDTVALSGTGQAVAVSMTMRSSITLDRDMTFKLACGTLAAVNTPPAGGTIPTLKWGWGSTVTSWLNVPCPAEQTASEPLTLTVYDAFTSEVWPILDPALGQQGASLILSR
ncbi:MAG: DUF2723 domain-containing protein [Anaerolineae bacterium]|nr:DUF2723 domain-containing protein [Anaerolineae bacterium]